MGFGVTQFSEWVVVAVSVDGSEVSGPHNAVLYGGATAISGFAEDESDAEVSGTVDGYGAPGLLFRPRSPESVSTVGGDVELGAESMAMRTSDGLIAMAWKDLRWNRTLPSGPAVGQIVLVGYGGGFFSLSDSDSDSGDQKASVVTAYCPYSFSNGTPSKAHAVILDPVEESVTIVHGDGAAVVLTDSSAILKSPGGNASIEVKDDAIILWGNVKVYGGMVVGLRDPLPGGGLPVLWGTAPGVPSTSLTVAS